MNIIEIIIIIIIILIIVILLYELYHELLRHYNRLNIYKMALEQSNKTNKPLIVYGDPYNGVGSKFWNKIFGTYGCGDMAVDLTGCPKCDNGIKSDILEHLKTIESDSAIIFISCVLEYVDNIEEVIKEIYRVAGSNNNIFIVCVSRYSLTGYSYSDGSDTSKNLIKAPPYNDMITFEKISK
jgi:hypothetical protein